GYYQTVRSIFRSTDSRPRSIYSDRLPSGNLQRPSVKKLSDSLGNILHSRHVSPVDIAPDVSEYIPPGPCLRADPLVVIRHMSRCNDVWPDCVLRHRLERENSRPTLIGRQHPG